jgi:hypothetical protein
LASPKFKPWSSENQFSKYVSKFTGSCCKMANSSCNSTFSTTMTHASVNLTDKRYWLEYHSRPNQKILGTQYHLILPTSISPEISGTINNLAPFHEWIYLLQPDHLCHRPFNFVTLNHRKARDRIS